jgi:hypothetical protein
VIARPGGALDVLAEAAECVLQRARMRRARVDLDDRHDLGGKNVAEPRLDRRGAVEGLARGGELGLDQPDRQGAEQIGLAVEMRTERRPREPRLARHVVHGGAAKAVAGEHRIGRRKNSLPRRRFGLGQVVLLRAAAEL